MDILLLHISGNTIAKSFDISFNPCFNGYTTFTAGNIKDAKDLRAVSILVLMDILLLQKVPRFNDGQFGRFQSLF